MLTHAHLPRIELPLTTQSTPHLLLLLKQFLFCGRHLLISLSLNAEGSCHTPSASPRSLATVALDFFLSD